MLCVILGGVIIGGTPLFIGLIIGFAIPTLRVSRIVAVSIVAILFLLSYAYQGLDTSVFKGSLHNTYTIVANNSLSLNALLSIIFTILGGDVARLIKKRNTKNFSPQISKASKLQNNTQ